jgi:hypothetical protein
VAAPALSNGPKWAVAAALLIKVLDVKTGKGK